MDRKRGRDQMAQNACNEMPSDLQNSIHTQCVAHDCPADFDHILKRNKNDLDSNELHSKEPEAQASRIYIPELLFATESWQGTKDVNEDRFINLAQQFPGPLFGIFDGHGGTYAADYLVRNLTKNVYSSWKQKHFEAYSELQSILTLSLAEMDRIQQLQMQKLGLEKQILEIKDVLCKDDSSQDETHAMRTLLEQLIEVMQSVDEKVAEIEKEEKERLFDFRDLTLKCESGFCDAIREGFDRTDAQLLRKPESNSGSTAVIVLFSGYAKDHLRYYVANLGDCRAVLCRNGRAIPLTVDHKPSRLAEKERITKAGGFVGVIRGIARVYAAAGAGLTVGSSIPAKYLSVSRAFGDISLKVPSMIVSAVPEVYNYNVEDEDLFIILACDGIWDVLSNQEAIDIGLRHFGDPKAAADAIVKQAYGNDSKDNLTVTVIQFGWKKAQALKILSAKATESTDKLSKNSSAAAEEEVDMFMT